MRTHSIALIASFLLLAACGDDVDPPGSDGGDAGEVSDARTDGGVDVGPSDAGLFDGGSADSGGDVGSRDLGTDAGSLDGGVPAADLEGYWRMRSIRFPGAPPITRTSSPSSTRSDYTFRARGDSSIIMDGKFLLLEDNLLTELSTDAETLTLERGSRLVFGASTVFTYVLDANALTLTYDESDPRNDPNGGDPREIILDRQAPPVGIVVGDWVLASMTIDGTPYAPGDCPSVGKDEWIAYILDILVEPRHLFDMFFASVIHGNDACTNEQRRQESSLYGAFEENGRVLDQWLVNRADPQSSGQYIQWQATTSTSGVTLTRSACEPARNCRGTPTRLEITPR